MSPFATGSRVEERSERADVTSRSIRLAAMCGLVALWSSACTSGGATEDPSRTDRAAYGGTLRLAIVYPDHLTDPASLDPARPYDPANQIDPELMRCCLVRTLLSYRGAPTDEGGTELHPDLATEMPDVSEDGLTWTFHLKDGIRYAPPLQDVEIKAADIARGIRRTAVAAVWGGSYSAYLSVIQGYDAFAAGRTDTIPGLEIVDAHTLRIHLTEVTNDFGYRMALPGSGPIPPSLWDPTAQLGVAQGHDDGYGPYLVASGPYMVQGAEQLDPSQPPAEQRPVSGLTQRSLTLVRNPSWEPRTDDLRPAYVDRIEFRVMTLREAERGIEAGTVDGTFDSASTSRVVRRFAADPHLASQVDFGLADLAVGYTAMNLAVPPFDDIHVRRAVNLAYDAERWTRVFNRHNGELSIRLGIVGHLAPDAIEVGLLRDFRPYTYDLAAARREMARSRYDRNGDGICDDPVCRNVRTLETDFGPERFADRVWAEDLGRIGISLNIRRIPDIYRYNAVSLDPTRHIALNLGGEWQADYPNASSFFRTQFTSVGIRQGIHGHTSGNESLVGASPGQLRRWGYDVTRVPNIDPDVRECLASVGFTQTRCWAQLDERLITDVVPWVPQNTFQFGSVISARIVSGPFDEAGGDLALDRVVLAPGSS